MPVNYGILQSPQMQLSPVTGSALSAPSLRPESDPLQEFSSGFLNSYQQGQQIQNNSETLKQNQMQTKQMEQKVSDDQERRDAAKQGWNQYLDVVGKQDPVAKVDAESKMTELQQKNAVARTADADSYTSLLKAQAQVWGRTAQGRTPEEKQAIYQISRKDLPDSVKKTLPENYSDSSMMAGMTIINYDLADYKSKHPESAASNSGLGKIQDDINKKQQVIDRRKAQGLDTTADEQQFEQLKQGANKEATPTKMVNSPISSALAGTDADIAKDASNVRTSMVQFRDTANAAKKALEKTPSLALGPVASVLNANNASPDVQVLRSSLNALALQAKELYKLGSGQGFTDADRDFLTMIVGNPGQYKGSIKTILGKMEELSNRVEKQNWQRENSIRKRSPDDYKDWLEANPDPSKIKAKPEEPTSNSSQPSQEDIQAEMKRRGLL